MSKEINGLTDECAVVLREARQKRKWDLAIAELMAQVLIVVHCQDGDNTLDFALAAAQTTITSILATDLKIGEDDQTKIDFETANTINFYAGNEKQLILTDGALTPGANNILDEDVPIVYDAANFSYDPKHHDPRGRLLYFGLKLLR